MVLSVGRVSYSGGGGGPCLSPPPPYHYREMLCMSICMSICMDKIALSLTSTSLRDLLRDKIIVPTSSTSEKHRSKYKSAHVL